MNLKEIREKETTYEMAFAGTNVYEEIKVNRIQIATVKAVENFYNEFARDIRNLTVPFLKIGGLLPYEVKVDELIKSYNNKLNQILKEVENG